jgi:hypothetical protein
MTIKLDRPGPQEVLLYFERAITDLFDMCKTNAQPYHKIIFVNNNTDRLREPLVLSFRYVHQLNADTLWTLCGYIERHSPDFVRLAILTTVKELGPLTNNVCSRSEIVA